MGLWQLAVIEIIQVNNVDAIDRLQNFWHMKSNPARLLLLLPQMLVMSWLTVISEMQMTNNHNYLCDQHSCNLVVEESLKL